MSRYAFGEILGNEAGLFARVRSLDDPGNADVPRDLKGYGLDAWLDCAVVGWDEPLQTYFLQGPEEGDELSWWFGTAYAEITTFLELCGVIQRLFADAVKFEFVDRIERAQQVRLAAVPLGGNVDGAAALSSAVAAAAVEVGPPT
ncbi:MAG TPA: hypothetical protein VI653_27165 [Steroidobacteraceae bacterium]